MTTEATLDEFETGTSSGEPRSLTLEERLTEFYALLKMGDSVGIQ